MVHFYAALPVHFSSGLDISQWKGALLQRAAGIFDKGGGRKEAASEKERDFHLQQIGQLKIELEWLKKKMQPFDL